MQPFLGGGQSARCDHINLSSNNLAKIVQWQIIVVIPERVLNFPANTQDSKQTAGKYREDYYFSALDYYWL
jgi:hypothetical protein